MKILTLEDAIWVARDLIGEGFLEDTLEKRLEAKATEPAIQPKKGEWIEHKSKRGTVIALTCPYCEKSPKRGIRSDFCPHCGADMRGEE